jgi:uncharacterized protein YggE
MAARPWVALAGVATGSAVLVAAAGALIRPGSVRAASTPPGTITVQASASVPVTELLATFSVGVDHQAPTAAAALAGDDQEMQRVIGAVERAGLPAKDLQTSNLSLNPVYAQSDGSPGPITGWDANDTLTVTALPAQVGRLIDAAVAAGANIVNSVSFQPADPNRAEAAALAAAVAAARAQAAAMASAAGLALGQVVSISTQVVQPEPVFAAAALASPPNLRTPVLSGQQTVTAQVVVNFAAGPA